ncbi:hypothetical protein K474DRAFT_1567705, partial [Panus rudis PR-1116 ss-1]
YQTPPLAGRPPFATDDDSVYDNQPNQQPTRRLRQPQPADPNARTSAYNVYDNYIEDSKRDSGVGALGMGLMNGDMDDDDPFDDNHKASLEKKTPQPIPLAAPKPGYAAPVAALNLARPAPAATPDGRLPSPQMSQVQGPKPLTLVTNMGNGSRVPPPAAINVPSTPHPLQPPMTPIMPVFARPSTASPAPRDVKFATTSPIMRGENEDTLLPRRPGADKGDFWRRFSMVVKEESAKNAAQKESWWLKKNRDGSSRTSRMIWVVAIFLLLCIAGGIGLGWYVSHNDTSHNAPTAIGGSANEKAIQESSSVAKAGGPTASSTPHVSPTNTVARRDYIPDPYPTHLAL